MAPVPPPPPLNAGDRDGSHNLVIGRWNNFTQSAFGGLVAGQVNTISNEEASISGGGFGNTASGFLASVSGGQFVIASGTNASVSGVLENTASLLNTVVLGGQGITDNKNISIAPQPPFP